MMNWEHFDPAPGYFIVESIRALRAIRGQFPIFAFPSPLRAFVSLSLNFRVHLCEFVAKTFVFNPLPAIKNI